MTAAPLADGPRSEAPKAELASRISEAMEREPPDADSLHALGIEASEAGHASAALELLSRAMDAAPKDPKHVLGIARLLLSEGMFQQATLAYLQAQELCPTDSGVLVELATALAQGKKAEDAAAVLARACQLGRAESKAAALAAALGALERGPDRHDALIAVAGLLAESGAGGFLRPLAHYAEGLGVELSLPARTDPTVQELRIKLTTLTRALSLKPGDPDLVRLAVPILCELSMEAEARLMLDAPRVSATSDPWLTLYRRVLKGPGASSPRVGEAARSDARGRPSVILAGAGFCDAGAILGALERSGFRRGGFLGSLTDLKADEGGMAYETHDYPPETLPAGFKVIYLFADPVMVALSAHEALNHWGRVYFSRLGCGPAFRANSVVLEDDPLRLQEHFDRWFRYHPFPLLAARYPDVFQTECLLALGQFVGATIAPSSWTRRTIAKDTPAALGVAATFTELSRRVEGARPVTILGDVRFHTVEARRA